MDSFVYCWTDNKTNKLYIGVHKGSQDDGYVCSSKLVLEQYRQRPEDFTRQIIAVGCWDDMIKLETSLLKAANVLEDNRYYNQAITNERFTCKGHHEETRKKMSHTWKNKDKLNCDQKKAIEVWRGNKHSKESKEKMSHSQLKHSKKRTERLVSNNPMKNKDSIIKMLETKRKNKEIRNGCSN